MLFYTRDLQHNTFYGALVDKAMTQSLSDNIQKIGLVIKL